MSASNSRSFQWLAIANVLSAPSFDFDRYDTYRWYLDLGPLSRVNAQYLHGKIPSWNDFVA
ncbi:MAG TPA: hypothetical protein VI231_17960, partial [Candidatus Binatia bacterium]